MGNRSNPRERDKGKKPSEKSEMTALAGIVYNSLFYLAGEAHKKRQ